jgi:LmbE family N-acetylglucosaminyl deacetylase
VSDIFVQPHFDDIALSCGGTVARAAANGDRPLIVTVFSGGPRTSELTQFARELHARWGTGDTPWLARADEDAAAVQALGADGVHLHHGEAIYRGYDTWPGITGAPHAEDAPVIAEIARQIEVLWRERPDARIYFPFGVGGHVDHQACHLAGAALIAAGAKVSFYEDFPYATVAGRLERRMAELGAAYSVELVDITAWMPQRLAAIGCYTSQLAFLFNADGYYPAPYESLVKKHAGFLGGDDRLAECFFTCLERRERATVEYGA